nr:hypothetical protein Iba_chr01bCG19770 [Ipomoea batatas]
MAENESPYATPKSSPNHLSAVPLSFKLHPFQFIGSRDTPRLERTQVRFHIRYINQILSQYHY